MVQQAGIDLCQYGAHEREAWATLLPKAQPSCWFAGRAVPELIYGSTPEQWSIQVQMTEELRIFELGTLPGSFPSERKCLPTTILWTPTTKERMEGPWIAKESLRVVDLRDVEEDIEGDMKEDMGYKDVFREHVDGFQDDNGPVCMMQYRAARERRTLRRSHSQPPPICRRAEEGQHGRSWLPRYHHCPYDSKWGFRCRQGRASGLMPDILRSCVEGILDGPFSVQEEWSWTCCSFLAGISNCQESQNDISVYIFGAHTGTEDCPWHCNKVDLAGLKVPEALKPYHPTSKSSAYEKYRVG